MHLIHLLYNIWVSTRLSLLLAECFFQKLVVHALSGHCKSSETQHWPPDLLCTLTIHPQNSQHPNRLDGLPMFHNMLQIDKSFVRSAAAIERFFPLCLPVWVPVTVPEPGRQQMVPDSALIFIIY